MAVELNRTRKANAGQESSHDIFADTLAELLALTADQLHALSLEPGALALCDDTKSLYVLTELAASGASPGVWNISGGQSAKAYGGIQAPAIGVTVVTAGTPVALVPFADAQDDGDNVVAQAAGGTLVVGSNGAGTYNCRAKGQVSVSVATRTATIRVIDDQLNVLATWEGTSNADNDPMPLDLDFFADLIVGQVLSFDVDADVDATGVDVAYASLAITKRS